MRVEQRDFHLLLALVEGLNEADRLAFQAVPCTAEGPRIWDVRPLHIWAERLGSDWFEPATQNLVFYGQPIVEVQTGHVVAYEALVRARLGEELIGAGPLLKAAAAHDQMRAFDALARTTAIRQLYGKLSPSQSLFINFAPGVVYNPDICLQTTFQACREVGADFSRLVFEVTEGEDFPDMRLLKSILERYRQEGARVALDDLGSGRTSLSYLAELKPDIVKLDRTLIQGLHPSKPAFRLVRSLVEYAHDLGIQVVAECVEQLEELIAVRETGVDLVQGYYLGGPAEVLNGISPVAAAWWRSQEQE
jgi:EAL domain-containing protein (putative c-di-GMP-specific phosphodiesterase class I)